ncbi:hypothetical protein [Maribacter sp. ACAM166]|uniref:hypothetical protein n=1 Tax=Maribacter sp. ACAM166 TaxID=2508996 RepID=UPI0010FE7A1C|nr:hypothetical protein [Maribacter sp. ACAM166]TLP79275.1 hypothetical protein ES765_10965 [Maribacter sp. ACAM166]
MKTLNILKIRLIERTMVATDEELLPAIENILNSTETADQLILDSHQIEMLILNETAIANGNLISESDLKKEDSEWMVY